MSSGQRRIVLGMAAAGVLIVGGSLLALQRGRIGPLSAYRSEREVPRQLMAGPRVSATLIRLRDGSDVHRITTPRGAGVVRLRFAADTPPDPLGYSVHVALEPRVLPRSVSLENLHPDNDGYLEMYLALSDLAGRTLHVTVTPASPQGPKPLSFRVHFEYSDTHP